MPALYDTIGRNYAEARRPDPSIRRAIEHALGDATTVVNVGAGSGSYEPTDRSVVAVELSETMIGQRPPAAAPVVQGTALSLPFRSSAFDAAMAILTVHHWSNKPHGLEELRRVSRGRVVILTWIPSGTKFWLSDYILQITDEDQSRFPSLQDYERALGPTGVTVVPVPHDCTDGFMCAYWRRPDAYLDPRVRAAISTFSRLGDQSPALHRLERDLKSGAWHDRYGELLERTEMDFGYRLIVAG